MKWQYLKCDGAGFLKNIFFWPKDARNMPENPVFCSKNCRNSWFSSRKNGFSSISRVVLNISFMNFCSIIVHLFFKVFSINVYICSHLSSFIIWSNQHPACFPIKIGRLNLMSVFYCKKCFSGRIFIFTKHTWMKQYQCCYFF